jgi:hypothetical protein
MADVKATITVLFYQIFWQNRGKFFFSFGRPEESQTVVVGAAATAAQATYGDDSDTSVDDNSKGTDTATGGSTEDGDKWEENFEYRPSCPLLSQLFEEHFTLSGPSRRQ